MAEDNKTVSEEWFADVWDKITEFGNAIWDPVYNGLSNFFGKTVPQWQISQDIAESWSNTFGSGYSGTSAMAEQVSDAWESGDYAAGVKYSLLTALTAVSETPGNGYGFVREAIGDVGDSLTSLTETLQSNGIMGNETMGEMLSQSTMVLGAVASSYANALKGYNDGVTETDFGSKEQSSWETMIKYIKSSDSKYRIKILRSTPLDPGENRQDLYGNMMLGAPFLMTDRTDPNNRHMIDTFIKDSRFIMLTPGMPKFNGSRYSHFGTRKSGDSRVYVNALEQTKTGQEMFDYLLKNGVDESNLDKDKRYYSFSPQYGKFYAYLETFLNMVWLKLGLGTEGDGTFNMFSFFGDDSESNVNGLTADDKAEVMARYRSAIGIFVNPSGAVTENITNEKTGYGGDLAAKVNGNSTEFQRINFLTGMGTATGIDAPRGILAKSMQLTTNMKNLLGQAFANTIEGFTENSGLARKIGGAALGAVKDVLSAYTKTDIGSDIQANITTNGMQVVYPELWSNGSFGRSASFQFNFTSPYGDPLSIFKYVYVPFGVILAFTLQRQADDNGFVSPFFLRADLPGYMTCDLGFISSMSFTRGGPSGLFTKDGLPRSISGEFILEDLYPYLAMSRRLSFLSANPAYTSFVDSMIGLNAVNSDDNQATLDQYWDAMLNRVNGNASGGLWNKYNSEGRVINADFGNRSNSIDMRQSKFKNADLKSTTWFRTV